MTRVQGDLCPVSGCGARRQRWQAVCGACWVRLPADLKAPIASARRRGARHLEARAAIVATEWLNAHAPAAVAAQRTGETAWG